MSTNRWLRGPLLGAALGLPILGGGGRLAMRRLARGALFATVLILLTLHGLQPGQLLPLALFLPLVLLYGALFEHVWHTRKQRSHILEPTT